MLNQMFKLLVPCYLLLQLVCSGTRLGNFIMTLDQNITNILSNPTIDQGEPLLYNLDEYITHIRDVNHLLKFNPKFMYKTAQQLYEERAPQLLKVDVDLEELHRIFQWEDFKTEAVEDYLGGIKNYTDIFYNIFPQLNETFGEFDYESNEQ